MKSDFVSALNSSGHGPTAVWAYLLAVILVLAFSAPSQAQETLQDGQVRELLVGHSATYSGAGVAVYWPDGKFSYTPHIGQPSQGKWSIVGGRICYDFKSGASRCDKVYRDQFGPYIINSSGQLYRFATGPTDDPPALKTAPLKECGLTVDYALQPPTADVPENIRAFAGI